MYFRKNGKVWWSNRDNSDLVRIDSTNINKFEKKGKILEKLKRYKDAISYYDKVLSIDANNKNAKENKEIILEGIRKETIINTKSGYENTTAIPTIKSNVDNLQQKKDTLLSDSVTVINGKTNQILQR